MKTEDKMRIKCNKKVTELEVYNIKNNNYYFNENNTLIKFCCF